MEIKRIHLIGLGAAFLILAISLIFIKSKFFFFLIGIGVIVGVMPFVMSIIQETKKENDKEEMFLEFARNLVESVKSGTPINNSIINVRDKSYGSLSPNIKKLANQISIGIPLKNALQTFSDDVNNKTVSRALTLIGQAERAGGDIGRILESVAEAVSMSDKLKKERSSAASTFVVQGYIIFFIFLVIILVMQYKILPLISGITTSGGLSGLSGALGGTTITTNTSGSISPAQLSNAFLFLLLVQGFFSGLTIGKLSEGAMKAGIKHSFTLMLISFLVSTGASLLFG